MNRFKIPNYKIDRFTLFNSIVSINESDDYDYLIESSNQIIDIRAIIIHIYFLSPDKMYKIEFENGLVATPNNENYGIINMNTKTIIHNQFYKDKFFSFCVYNNKPKYTIGAIKNCEQYTKQYPDYKSLFYIRSDVPNEIITKIEELKGIVIRTLFVPDWFMMFGRFLPFELADFNSSRDTDCRLINREIYVNEKFISSKYLFHIIRDHPYHSTEILGGMWSSKNLIIKNLRFLILHFCLQNMNNQNVSMGHDQNFLAKYIYPLLNIQNILTHDNYFHYTAKCMIDIPRINKEYIGEAYDENDNIDINLRNVISSS